MKIKIITLVQLAIQAGKCFPGDEYGALVFGTRALCILPIFPHTEFKKCTKGLL